MSDKNVCPLFHNCNTWKISSFVNCAEKLLSPQFKNSGQIRQTISELLMHRFNMCPIYP